MITPQIENSWKQVLWDQFQAPYFAELKRFLIEEKQHYRVFPPGNCIFNAFNSTPVDQVKVVIIGQDPYHEPGRAGARIVLFRAGWGSLPQVVD